MHSLALVNGKIYVSFKPLKVASGMLVSSGRVLYVGNSSTAAELAALLNAPTYDLKGRVVVPGFIDSHLHLDTLGLALSTLDLRGVKSIRELKEKLRIYAEKSELTWILGHGWDHELFEEKRWPTRWDLDEAVPSKPVLLTRVCLHAGVMNTAGLKATGLLEKVVEGVVRDERGEPTGVVLEEALRLAREELKKTLSVEDYAKYIRVAQEHLLSLGITTVGIPGCSLKALKALVLLKERGELKIRCRVYLNPYDEGVNIIEALSRLGIRCGFGDDYLKIMGIKLFVDGALGARTAWLSAPYSDDPSTSGLAVTPPSDLEEFAKLADEAGLQLAVHAIGDRAVEEALRIYSMLRNTAKLRHRIEHASLLREDLLKEASRIKPVVVVQPHFVITDWWAKNRLGERVRWLYAFKSMLKSGLPMAFSTDAPVEPANPWETIYAAITRGRYEEIPYYEETAHEVLSLEEALHLYTKGSAYALHEENELGSLEPGTHADFAVLDRDPLLITDLRGLREIRVLETYVNGIRVYSA